jgi:DNA-directed RNA polymerase specialized sigma subunit
MENELYDLVQKAQDGDKVALDRIIDMFLPAIRSARRKINREFQDDLEQDIVEFMINKIVSYDLSQTPDFSSFCMQMNELKSVIPGD